MANDGAPFFNGKNSIGIDVICVPRLSAFKGNRFNVACESTLANRLVVNAGYGFNVATCGLTIQWMHDDYGKIALTLISSQVRQADNSDVLRLQRKQRADLTEPVPFRLGQNA